MRSSVTFRKRTRAPKIYRENNQRYVAIKYSVRGRALGEHVREAIQKVNCPGKTSTRISHRMGGRVPERSARRGADADHRALNRVADLHHPVLDVQIGQMGSGDLNERRHGTCRRIAGATIHSHQFQRVVERRFSRPVRCFGADRRDHAGVHQSTACARAFHRRVRDGRCGVCVCVPS